MPGLAVYPESKVDILFMVISLRQAYAGNNVVGHLTVPVCVNTNCSSLSA